MSTTKKQFMNKEKMLALPKAERARRWDQHIDAVRGRGDYTKPQPSFARRAASWVDNKVLKKLPKGTFASAGGLMAGAPGAAAGALLAQLTGRGDYMIKSNSLIMDSGLKPSAMSFSPSGASSIRVQKREFITNIVSPANPTAFNQAQFRLQCTDATTFPWLAAIAEHFSEWSLQGAILSFESTSSNYSADMALGTIAIATQYNANELPYQSMEQILQAAFHSRGNPSESMMHGVECDPSLQASDHLFTKRRGTSGPPNLYDHGVVTVATEGLPASAGTIIGRLFITYDIELNIPTLPIASAQMGRSAGLRSGTASTTTPPLGETLSVSQQITAAAAGLSAGTGYGNNILLLTPSPGNVARPEVPLLARASLMAWLSDSTTIAGCQYLSFCNPGTFKLQITFKAQSGTFASPPALAVIEPLTSEATLVVYESNLSVGDSQNLYTYIYTLTCTSSDQSFSLRRMTATDTITWSVLTVCS
jgi:hypothetical protein